MEKSLFAGLTILDPGESLLDDGGEFIGKDRETIDRFLQQGAKTHRHTGEAGLSSPAFSPEMVIVGSGGTVGSDLSLSVGYTVEDRYGGETLISPLASGVTPGPISPPASAISAVVDYDAGSLTVGDYFYGLTYADAEGGETPLGSVALVEREPGFLNAEVTISGMAGGLIPAGATAWRLYRAINGGDFCYLASGVADSFVDDGTICSTGDITPPPDDGGTTNGVNSFLVTVPSAGVVGASFIRLYLGLSGSFVGDVLLDRLPVASAGQTILYSSLDTDEGQPPARNVSVGMPHQIDPDSELLDWHWKRPVANPSLLGSGETGDVKFALNDGTLWGMLNSPSGGVGDWRELGASAALAVTDEDGPVDAAVTKLAFAGSGEVQVGLTDLGGGSARVTVYAPSAAASPLYASGSPRVGPLKELAFAASGGATLRVEDVGGGSALVQISAPSASQGAQGASGAPGAQGIQGIQGVQGDPGPPGTGGGAAAFYASAEGPKLGPLSELDFSASAGAAVSVQSLGGGSAMVVISASGATGATGTQGPQGVPGVQGDPGPPGTGGGAGAHYMAGSAGVQITSDGGYTEYRASGALNLAVASLGANSGAVTMAPLGRRWASANVGSLASGASGSYNFAASAAGGHILMLSTNKRARVRVYGDAMARTADLARGNATDPSGDHGVQLDYMATTTASGGIFRVTPVVDSYNLDVPPANTFYLNVYNYDLTGNVIVAFLYVPTEVV